MSKQEAKVVNMEETTVENTVEETVETTDVESTEVMIEEPKFYKKVLGGIQKHGKKIAGAALLAGLGIAAYALGKKAGSDDDYDYDYDSMSIDFGGSDNVVADIDCVVTDSDVTTEE